MVFKSHFGVLFIFVQSHASQMYLFHAVFECVSVPIVFCVVGRLDGTGVQRFGCFYDLVVFCLMGIVRSVSVSVGLQLDSSILRGFAFSNFSLQVCQTDCVPSRCCSRSICQYPVPFFSCDYLRHSRID